MFNFELILLNLKKQLYPTGRAFRVLTKSFKEKAHQAYGVQENVAYQDGLRVLDSLLPDNDGYTEEDATTDEKRYGILTSAGTSFEDRKLAIIRKIQHPGRIRARQHYLYIQSQLRNAGFDVFVHENRFALGSGWETKDPAIFYPAEGVPLQYGQAQFGSTQAGYIFYDLIVNSINPELDKSFNYAGLEQTFFIAGLNLGDFGTVDAVRESEFRQLVLKLKPVHTVAFVFVNFN